MRVLSSEEFVKKVDYAVEREDPKYTPVIEIRPNWQLKLSIPQDGQDLGRWLGPNPAEMVPGDYTVFLSEVDARAGSRFAANYVLDAMPREGGQ